MVPGFTFFEINCGLRLMGSRWNWTSYVLNALILKIFCISMTCLAQKPRELPNSADSWIFENIENSQKPAKKNSKKNQRKSIRNIRAFKPMNQKSESNWQIAYAKDLSPSLTTKAPRYTANNNPNLSPWQSRSIKFDDYGQFGINLATPLARRVWVRSGIAWQYLQGREERFDLPAVFANKETFGVNNHRFDILRPSLDFAYKSQSANLSLLAGLGLEISYLNYTYEFSNQQSIDDRQLLARNQIYRTQLLNRGVLSVLYNLKALTINFEIIGLIAGRTLHLSQTSRLQTEGKILPGFTDSDASFAESFGLQARKHNIRIQIGCGATFDQR